MLHTDRTYRIEDLQSGHELVRKLRYDGGQTLCQGYFYHGLLWLNDSLTPDPDRFWEYAVMHPIDALPEPGKQGPVVLAQVESITVNTGDSFPWSLRKEVDALPLQALAGRFILDDRPIVWLDRRPGHVCLFCR